MFFCGGQLSCLSGVRPGREVPCVGWPTCGRLGSGHRVAATHSFPVCPLTAEVSKPIVPDLQDTEKREEAIKENCVPWAPWGRASSHRALALLLLATCCAARLS